MWSGTGLSNPISSTLIGAALVLAWLDAQDLRDRTAKDCDPIALFADPDSAHALILRGGR